MFLWLNKTKIFIINMHITCNDTNLFLNEDFNFSTFLLNVYRNTLQDSYGSGFFPGVLPAFLFINLFLHKKKYKLNVQYFAFFSERFSTRKYWCRWNFWSAKFQEMYEPWNQYRCNLNPRFPKIRKLEPKLILNSYKTNSTNLDNEIK